MPAAWPAGCWTALVLLRCLLITSDGRGGRCRGEASRERPLDRCSRAVSRPSLNVDKQGGCRRVVRCILGPAGAQRCPAACHAGAAHLLGHHPHMLSLVQMKQVMVSHVNEMARGNKVKGKERAGRQKNREKSKTVRLPKRQPAESRLSAAWAGSRLPPCCAWRWVCAPPSRPALCRPLSGSLAATCGMEGRAGERGQDGGLGNTHGMQCGRGDAPKISRKGWAAPKVGRRCVRKTLLDGVEGSAKEKEKGTCVYICMDEGMRFCWIVSVVG